MCSNNKIFGNVKKIKFNLKLIFNEILTAKTYLLWNREQINKFLYFSKLLIEKVLDFQTKTEKLLIFIFLLFETKNIKYLC